MTEARGAIKKEYLMKSDSQQISNSRTFAQYLCGEITRIYSRSFIK